MIDYRRVAPTMPMLFTGGYIPSYSNHVPIGCFQQYHVFQQNPQMLMCKHNPINHHQSPWVPQSHHQSTMVDRHG